MQCFDLGWPPVGPEAGREEGWLFFGAWARRRPPLFAQTRSGCRPGASNHWQPWHFLIASFLCPGLSAADRKALRLRKGLPSAPKGHHSAKCGPRAAKSSSKPNGHLLEAGPLQGPSLGRESDLPRRYYLLTTGGEAGEPWMKRWAGRRGRRPSPGSLMRYKRQKHPGPARMEPRSPELRPAPNFWLALCPTGLGPGSWLPGTCAASRSKGPHGGRSWGPFPGSPSLLIHLFASAFD